MKYAIRLNSEPVWFTNGIEDLFDTEDEAIAAIEEEIKECEHAVELGYMTDVGGFEEFRIVEVTK